MPIKVLDSFALMAYFQDEKGADLVEKIILDAQYGKTVLLMSVVNLGEVWYTLSRAYSTEIAESQIKKSQNLPIKIVDVDWELTRQAALYKARGNIAYADCFAAALAKLNDAEVVTGDKEFAIVEDDVKVLWLK